MLNDLRYAIRMLRKNSGFTAMAVATLALGIGANTAIFSVVQAVLLRPPPFADPDRLVVVWETHLKSGLKKGIASPANFLDWQERTQSFEHLAAWRTWFYTLSDGVEPEQVWGVRTSADFFQLLGVEAQAGRTFLADEEQAGHSAVVVLSYGLWWRRFGGDPKWIGRTITIDRRPVTVIGVLPANFDLFGGSRQYDLWMPFPIDRGEVRRDDYSIIVFGRLRKDVTLDQAQTEMNSIARQLEREYPVTNQGRSVRVMTLQEHQIENLKPALLILFAAVSFVLLIACANVANLTVSRSVTRWKEVGIRAALGAGSFRLAREALTESLLLGMLGGGSGLVLAFTGLHLLKNQVQKGGVGDIPRAEGIGLNLVVLSFALAMSVLTGIVSSLGSVVQIIGTDLNGVLKQSGRSSTEGPLGCWYRSMLVVCETALAVVLLVGAGLMVKSLYRMLTVDPGFRPENVLTVQIWLPESKYPRAQQVVQFYHETLQRIQVLPGVQSASAINFLPLSGWGDSVQIDVDGQTPAVPGEHPVAQYRVIDPAYFQTMRIRLLQGRAFSELDYQSLVGVVVVNETLARRYWPQTNALGRHLRLVFPDTRAPWRPESSQSWLTIVGVVGDVKEFGVMEEVVPQVYLPYSQYPSRLMRLAVRSVLEPASVAASVKQAVRAVDAEQPVTEPKTLQLFLDESMFRQRFNLYLLGLFAVVALVLSALGIYGVISHSVAQQTHEIGVRMALGAEATHVLRLVLSQGMTLALVGTGLGLAASLAMTRVMRNLIFGVSTSDPLVLLVISLLLVLVALLACYIPARRAAKVDPMAALRYE